MGRAANLLTGLFVLLTVAVVVGGVWFIFLRPQPPVPVAALPTVAVVPTLPTNTPSVTSRPTLPATFTPTPTITPTLSVTPTLTLTISPTPTITDTPTATPTPETTDTPTPTMTPTPTETSNIPTNTPTATRSPFPFEVRGGQAVFTQNTFNAQGCAFQAIAGQVLNTQNAGLDGIEIIVTEPGGTERGGVSGNNTTYGEGGYEVPVDDQINGRTYIVQLRSAGGTELSQPYTLTFPSNCDQNIALIYWSQTRPF